MVFNVRWINTGDSHFTMAPSPSSYVPLMGTELTDKMDFMDRVKNVLFQIFTEIELQFFIYPMYSNVMARHFPPGSDLLSLQLSADIWLVVADFVIEFPRPTMPNVVYIGGFQCQEPSPLPDELEKFVESSGDHGVIVMSTGTSVIALPRNTTEAIAAAFAELPQKIIWKYTRQPPTTLGNNTLLVKWLPQNDLLGHPKTRVFVTHGGTNSIYEAIYHGVPVVGLPLLFDQFDNVIRLQARGAARIVEAKSITKESFLEAVKDVVENPSYRENIQHLSKLHRDKPMTPMDTALFWIEMWTPLSLTLCVLSAVLLRCPGGDSSRILVAPVDGSHWLNMELILRQLHARGHEITVLHSAKSWYIPENSTVYTSINIRILKDKEDMEVYNRILIDVIECRKKSQFMSSFCQKYILTLMLTDPGFPLGTILGRYLKLPMVFNVRWINTGDSHFTMAPSPSSYVPLTGTELTDKMDFMDRVKNVLFQIYSEVELQFLIYPAYSNLMARHFPPGSDLLSLQLSADIWLVRADFVFEFPRPTMPNVVYIGGFQCQEPSPLPDELEKFVESSGDHGVIVMSIGTFVFALPQKTTEAIVAAFAELPQKVIWRYSGQPPTALGNNTLLVKWLPQKDLLGHPKTRAFVTHGGTNGIYEAIYHGVPVVGLPLLFDQFDNVIRLQARGAARIVEAKSITKESFMEAVKDVVENPSYLENIQRLSRLHHDKPMTPMDTALFWIEYVIRNKGVPHLQAVGYSLPWYSYFCLDVVAFLLAIVVAVVWFSMFCCRLLCCRRSKRKLKGE
ncbi:UDP-glucuronosyltransferase 2B17-like [Boleophthalmus pectinirostris]|uniref:UDP-glucuronosyltransferase 2B17-like n=1 Tax=Boleophthalmus pectinirostris TaxID=150288 RepID=UPI00242BB1DF|nr:UDP-glucuronosyltransferase 2B17-like [Boleophthalmus pectinirostris]